MKTTYTCQQWMQRHTAQSQRLSCKHRHHRSGRPFASSCIYIYILYMYVKSPIALPSLSFHHSCLNRPQVKGLSDSRVCIFSLQDILVGQEVTYAYPPPHTVGLGVVTAPTCLCRASGCRGRMCIREQLWESTVWPYEATQFYFFGLLGWAIFGLHVSCVFGGGFCFYNSCFCAHAIFWSWGEQGACLV